MEIKVIHMTKDGFDDTNRSLIESAKVLAGREAGICYMSDNYLSDKIQNSETAIKRAKGILKSGHHSPFDHFTIGLEITGIPKIMAMILNSTEMYTTSEKSARYTVMHPESQLELDTYNWWTEKFKEVINEEYPTIIDKELEKLAIENARYMISVFTTTSMGYTTTFRQLSYMIGWLTDLEKSLEANYTRFNAKLLVYVQELKEKLTDVVGYELRDNKSRNFKFLRKQYNKDAYDMHSYIGDVYHIEYNCSFACLAQLQRHRTISYIMDFDGTEKAECFIPPILYKHPELVNKWKSDFMKLKDYFPQCTLVHVIESGMTINFVNKCCERLCGRAQLEIALNCKNVYEQIIHNHNNMSNDTLNYIRNHSVWLNSETEEFDYAPCTKCDMPNFKCTEACRWGKNGLNRLI